MAGTAKREAPQVQAPWRAHGPGSAFGAWLSRRRTRETMREGLMEAMEQRSTDESASTASLRNLPDRMTARGLRQVRISDDSREPNGVFGVEMHTLHGYWGAS